MLALALGVAVTVGVAPAAHADAAYTLSADAQGVSVVVANNGLPLIASAQVNTPSARADLNSRGEADAYSAAPDPGQDVAELPGVGASQLCAILQGYGLNLPGCAQVEALIPAYPYAYAQAGDDPQDKSFGGAHLHAQASSDGSEGQTVVGADGVASTTSTARTAAASDGSQLADAVTSVDAFQLGSYLRISGMRADAEIQRDSSGRVTLTSSFQIGHLLVNGLDIGYDDGTFEVLGTQVPVPVPVGTVLGALEAAGITASFLPAIKTDHGIVSEGLLLSYRLPGAPSGVVPPIPLPLPIGVGLPTEPTTITYVLGRATVDSSYHPIPSVPVGIFGPTAFPTTPGATTAPTAGSAPLPVTGGLGGSTGAVPTTGAPLAPVPGPSLAPATGAGPITVSAEPRAAVTSNGIDIYLAFVVTALTIFGGALAIRFLGVRLSWTS